MLEGRQARECCKTHELAREDVDGRCQRWGIVHQGIWWECSIKGQRVGGDEASGEIHTPKPDPNERT